MALIKHVESILGKRVLPGFFQIFPAKKCRYKGKEYFVHGFHDDDSNEHPETFVLSDREDSIGQWKRVPYQEVELLAEKFEPTKSLVGHKLTKVAGIYMLEDGKKIPAKMVKDGKLVWVYGMTDADHGVVCYWVGPENFDPKDEPRMVVETDVILLG